MKIVRALKLAGAAVMLAALVGACSNASPSPSGGAPTVAPTVVVPSTSAPASTVAPSSS